MDDEKSGVLENYIKKGLERGFNINYIKDTLSKHGHGSERIETAANNVAGMKYPEELKPHMEETEYAKPKQKYPVFLVVLVVVLVLIVGFFTVNYFANRGKINEVQSEMDEIEELGLDIDDLSTTMETQLELLKEKDLTIEEKEDIIEDQIELIEEINEKFESQKTKIDKVLLEIMNRMIGRMSG